MLNAGCGLLAPLKDQVEAKAFQETSILYKLTMKSSHRWLQTPGPGGVRHEIRPIRMRHL